MPACTSRSRKLSSSRPQPQNCSRREAGQSPGEIGMVQTVQGTAGHGTAAHGSAEQDAQLGLHSCSTAAAAACMCPPGCRTH